MNNTLLRLAVLLVILLTAKTATAAVQPDGVLDEVAARFLAASSTWGATITNYASWLFWGARRIRKKSYAKVFRASVRAETSRLPVCGSAARRNRRLG